MIKIICVLSFLGTFSTFAQSNFKLEKTLNIGSSVIKSEQSEQLNYSLETSENISTAKLLKRISQQTAKHDVSDSQAIPHKQNVKTKKFRFWGEVFTNERNQSFAIFMLAPQNLSKKVPVGSTSTRLNISPVPLNSEKSHSFKLPWGEHLILRRQYTFDDKFLGKKNGVFFQNKDHPYFVGALIQVKSLGQDVNNFGRQFFKYIRKD